MKVLSIRSNWILECRLVYIISVYTEKKETSLEIYRVWRRFTKPLDYCINLQNPQKVTKFHRFTYKTIVSSAAAVVFHRTSIGFRTGSLSSRLKLVIKIAVPVFRTQLYTNIYEYLTYWQDKCLHYAMIIECGY